MQEVSIHNSDKQQYIALVTSGKETYHLDMLNTLFLPTFSFYRFRYRRKYVSDVILEQLKKNIHELDGRVGFVVLYREADVSQEFCLLIRKIKIKNVELSAGFIYVQFQNLEFIDYEKAVQGSREIADQIIRDFSENKKYMYSTEFSVSQINEAFSSKTDDETKWSKVIEKISEIGDFEKDIFLRLRRIVDVSEVKSIQVESASGTYKLSGSKNYELEIIQSVGKKSSTGCIVDKGVEITLSAPESHIKFITKNTTVLSRYDLLKIQFRARKRVRGTETILTISPNKEQMSLAKQKDKMPTAMAESTIHLSVGASQEVRWIVPLIFAGLFVAGIGAAIASEDFAWGRTLIGSAVSGVGALLSAYLGLRYLSEE